MYIEIISLSEFWSNGEKVKLPSNMVRYLEFEKIVVFLIKENDKNNKIIGIKFSQDNGINRHNLAWEFQIIDGLGESHEIVLMERQTFNRKEIIYCNGWGFDIGYYIDPDTGEVIHTEPIK
jgi:hypothetical protein